MAVDSGSGGKSKKYTPEQAKKGRESAAAQRQQMTQAVKTQGERKSTPEPNFDQF